MAEIEYTHYGERADIEEGYSIGELINLLLSKIKLITIITLVFGLVAFSISQFVLTPQYEASVSLFVNNSKNQQADTTNISDLNASQRLVNTYIEIVKSNTVMNKVVKNSGLDYSLAQFKEMVSTEAVSETEIFYVTVKSENPEHAALLANQIAKDAPDEIMDFVEATSVKVIDYATVPKLPSEPNIKLNTAIGLLLGLALSVLLVFLMDMLDVRIKTEEEIQQLVNLPVLGVIPTITINNKTSNGPGGKYEY